MIIHLRIGIAPGLKRPTRGYRAGHPFHPPIWSCSRWGLPSYPGHPEYWWALTPPFHPYYAIGVAVSFLWHFPSRHRDWALPSILPFGARTFLPPYRRHDERSFNPLPLKQIKDNWNKVFFLLNMLNWERRCYIQEILDSGYWIKTKAIRITGLETAFH